MTGWKTKVGVVLFAIGSGLIAIGQPDFGAAAVSLAAAFGFYGIGHKIERIKR